MRKAYILMVEDNPDDEELMTRAFKKGNILNEIVVVRDGQQALDFLFGRGMYEERDIDDQPVLVLLDLKLPRIGGLEVLKEVRSKELTRRIPVVIITSSKEDNDILSAYGLGANSYIRKPVDFKEFTSAIRQLGTYWLFLNEAPPG